MNIIEAYIKFNGQLIILISGLAGCGKRLLAKNISNDFKLSLVKLSDFKIIDNNEKVKLKNGRKIVNWYTDNAYDWDAFNKTINEQKINGVVVEGMSFPKDKLRFMTNYHLHVSITKHNCYDKKKKLIEKAKDKNPKKYSDLESGHIKLKFNQIILPYYYESLKTSIITKFINGNELDNEQIYDLAFDSIIEFIQKYIDEYNKNLSPTEDKHDIVRKSLENDYKLAEMGRAQSKYEEDLKLVNYEESSITPEALPMENIIYNRFRDSSDYNIESSS